MAVTDRATRPRKRRSPRGWAWEPGLCQTREPELLSPDPGSRALRLYDLQQDNRRLKIQQGSALSGVIARDAGMLKLCRLIERVASANVLTVMPGREWYGGSCWPGAARTVARRNERFSCDQLRGNSRELLESELFGYEREAFTGLSSRP